LSLLLPRLSLRFGLAHMVLAVALLLVSLFAYAAVQTAAQSYGLSEERHRLELELWELRRQRSELEGLVVYLGSEEYVESVARQQLGLAREGEIAVLIDAPEGEGARREPGERWWEALFGR
jgi:cell division protein FtsB